MRRKYLNMKKGLRGNMTPLILTLFAGIFIIGGLLLGFYSRDHKKMMNLVIGVAFGVVVALMIFELLPEAYEKLQVTPMWKTIAMLTITILIGILLMNILDNFVPHHEHESHHHHKHKDDTCHNEHLNHIGILSTVALLLHNIIEGMTLYVAAHASISSGYLLCVGIGLHNIPLGILVAGTLHTKKETWVTGTLLSLSTFIGGLLMYFIRSIMSEFVVGLLIALTVGMLVYIAFIELLGQIIHSEHKKISWLGVAIGILLFTISGIME